MKRIHMASALFVLATFIMGAATGAGLHAWKYPRHGRGGPHPRGGPPHYLRELGLTEEQRSKAEPIFTKHRAAMDEMMKDTFPKMRALNDEMEKELRPLLTPEQVKQLDELKSRPPPPRPF